MTRRLFQTLVVSQPSRRRRHGRAGFPLSAGAHAAGLAALMTLPAFTHALPEPAPPLPVVALPPVVRLPQTPPPPPDVRASVSRSLRAGGESERAPTPSLSRASVLLADPTGHEDRIPDAGDLGWTLCPDCEPSAVPIGAYGPPGLPTGDGSPAVPGPIRPSGGVRPPSKLQHVEPVYPDLALRTHVEGTVVVECTIGADGHVSEAHVLRGHPLLDQSALDAVRQWRYTPTLLNGIPVSVVLTVTVRFSLS